jgi:hypothetical protein
MAKLSKDEADQLAALRAKEEAPDEPEGDDDDGQGDDGHVIVLRGSRADSFLEQLLGPAKPAKKAAPAKGKPAGDGDEGAGAEGNDDAAPPRVNRYFK